jgi:hypothetical protein
MRRITPGRITGRQAAKAAAAQQQHEQDQLLDYMYSFETEPADGSALANLLLDMLALFIPPIRSKKARHDGLFCFPRAVAPV